MKGYIDAESAGETMDFEITYKEHKLTVLSSDWYAGYYIEDEISYEKFCEDWGLDEARVSKKAFESAKKKGMMLLIAGRPVSKIELTDIMIIDI